MRNISQTVKALRLLKTNGQTKTITRNDLIEVISDKVGLSLNDSSEMIETIFDFILTELESGDDVKISSFGTFKVKRKNLRMGSMQSKKFLNEDKSRLKSIESQ